MLKGYPYKGINKKREELACLTKLALCVYSGFSIELFFGKLLNIAWNIVDYFLECCYSSMLRQRLYTFEQQKGNRTTFLWNVQSARGKLFRIIILQHESKAPCTRERIRLGLVPNWSG